MKRLLDRMADRKLKGRSDRFVSRGDIGRRKPRLVLVNEFAKAVGSADVGSKVDLNVRGTVTGRGTLGQRHEAVLVETKRPKNQKPLHPIHCSKWRNG